MIEILQGDCLERMRGMADNSVHAVVTDPSSGLVQDIAHNLIRRLPASVELDDLLQAGRVGLIEAARRFDAAHGASFQVFAYPRIHGAMLDECRKATWAPRSVLRKGRELTQGVSESDDHALRADLARVRFQSLQEFVLDDEEGWQSVIASPDPGPEELAEHEELIAPLRAALQTLPEREQRVLSLYYDEGLNLKEIGSVLDVSESRVSQLRAQALKTLRAVIAS